MWAVDPLDGTTNFVHAICGPSRPPSARSRTSAGRARRPWTWPGPRPVFDGFFELGLSTWDVAAGVLLIEEAGGLTSDWAGGDSHVATGDILAGNPAVHQELVRVAAPA